MFKGNEFYCFHGFPMALKINSLKSYYSSYVLQMIASLVDYQILIHKMYIYIVER